MLADAPQRGLTQDDYSETDAIIAVSTNAILQLATSYLNFAYPVSPALRRRMVSRRRTALEPTEAFARVQSVGGTDVILELIGARNMPDDVRVLAPRGRIVGAAPGDEASFPLRDLMSRRGHIIATTLRRRPLEQKADLVQEFGRRVVPQLGTHKMAPVIDPVFDLDDAADALDQIRVRGKFGKILLAI